MKERAPSISMSIGKTGEDTKASRWGYQFGREWANGLSDSDLNHASELLLESELDDLSAEFERLFAADLLPRDVAAQRAWRIESLQSEDEFKIFGDAVIFDFDFAFREAVWDEQSDRSTGSDENSGEEEDSA